MPHMTTIATFGDALEANLARNYLESAGIPSFLADEMTMGVAWHLGVAIGGVKLQVADEIEYEARQALAERAAAVSDAEPETGAAEDASQPSEPIDAAPPDEPEVVLTPRELNADRAWRGMVFCLFFLPLQLYIFWLLLKVFLSDERLATPYRHHAIIAAMVNLPIVLAILYWLRTLLPV
jgi:hypothetical protein